MSFFRKLGIDFQDRVDNQLTHIAEIQLSTINATNTLCATRQSNARQHGLTIARVNQNIEGLIAQQHQMAQQVATLV
jgi:hypothetical protein